MKHPVQTREARLSTLGARSLLRDASYHLSDAQIFRLIDLLSPDVLVAVHSGEEFPVAILAVSQVEPGGIHHFDLDFDDIEEIEQDPSTRPDFFDTL